MKNVKKMCPVSSSEAACCFEHYLVWLQHQPDHEGLQSTQIEFTTPNSSF